MDVLLAKTWSKASEVRPLGPATPNLLHGLQIYQRNLQVGLSLQETLEKGFHLFCKKEVLDVEHLINNKWKGRKEYGY